MDHDRTFHLVDEDVVREEIVPALLGRRDPPRDLEGRGGDTADIWAKTRVSLRDDPPGDGRKDAWNDGNLAQSAILQSPGRPAPPR